MKRTQDRLSANFNQESHFIGIINHSRLSNGLCMHGQEVFHRILRRGSAARREEWTLRSDRFMMSFFATISHLWSASEGAQSLSRLGEEKKTHGDLF